MKTLLFFLLLVCRLAVAQVYPGAIATDKDLYPEINDGKYLLTLAANMLNTDTSFTVTGSTAALVPYSLILLEGEIVQICSINFQTVLIGHSSCANIDGRGYDGTSAVQHAKGVRLHSQHLDINHNSVKDEIKAIEAAIGANNTTRKYYPNPKDNVGVQAAVNLALASGGGIVELDGAYTFKAGVTWAGSNVKIRGSGALSTVISRDTNFPSFSIFTVTGGQGNEFSNYSTALIGPGSATGCGIDSNNQAFLFINNITEGSPCGFLLTSAGYTIVKDSLLGSIAHDQVGIFIVGGTDVIITNIFLGVKDTSNPGFAGIYLNPGSTDYISNVDAILFNFGVFIGASGGQFLHLKNVTAAGHGSGTHVPFAMAPVSPGRVVGFTCEDCEAFDGLNDGVSLNATQGNIYGVKWVNSRIYNNGGHGFHIVDGAFHTYDTQIIGGSISGNGATSGDEIRIGANVNNVNIHDVTIGMADAPAADAYWNPTANLGLGIEAGTSNNIFVSNNNFTGGYVTGAFSATGVTGANNRIENNIGLNPVGPANVTVTSSPMTYTNGSTPSMLYIKDGTVSSVVKGGITLCTATPCNVLLPPNGIIVITYSVAPTMSIDVQ